LYKFYIAYYVFIFVKMRIACDERMRFPSYFEFWALLYASQKNPIRVLFGPYSNGRQRSSEGGG
jgi:hypothetical protein